MYNASSGFLTAVKQHSRLLGVKVIINSNTYFEDKIVEMVYEDTSNSSDAFSIGDVSSAVLELTLTGVNEVFETATVTPYIGVSVNGTLEYVPLGVFYVDVIDKKKNVTKLTCYDGMIKLEKGYFSNLTYPATITAVMNEICSQAGVQFSGTLPGYSIDTKPEGYTHREMVAIIAAMCGGFAKFNRSGQLVIKSYATIAESIAADQYIEYVKKKDDVYRVDKVTCQVSENNTISKGTLLAGGSEVTFSNPYVTDAVLTDIYNKLNGFQYMPFYVKFNGNPALECGDIITFTTIDNQTYNIPIMSHKLMYSGGLVSEIESVGETQNSNQFSSSGSLTQRVDRVVYEQAIINDALVNRLDATNARIDNLRVTTAMIDDLSVTTAKIADAAITNTKIANAAIDNAKIANAAIGTAQIQTGAITNALIADAAITSAKIQNLAVGTAQIADGSIVTAKIGDAQITGAKIASATITSANIQDGTITNANIANATITGAKIANATIGTAQIADASITSAKIQDGAITNADIANATITGAKIANATITGANIASATIDTANIKAGAITTALIGTGAVQTAQIADGSITDAKIVSLTANKIAAGTIDTSQVTVQGANGKLRISGNRLQVFDNQQTPVERVSLGDVNGDGTVYGLKVRGSDGTTILYDHNGVYSAGITDGAITNPKISDGAVTNRTIAANTITGDKLVADSITSREIATGAITANELAANAITAGSAVIADGAITTAKIGDAQITNAKIANLAIDSFKIADAAITSAKIASAAVGNAAIANAAVTNAKIANLAVSTAQIQDGAITNAKIANAAIGAAAIANAAIGTAHIADGAITNAKIANAAIDNAKISSVDAGKITTGTLNAGRIGASSITVDKLVISDFTNLCENPDFENDTVGSVPKGFGSSYARVVDISGFTNGNGSNKALEIDARNGGNSDVYSSAIFPVRPGQKFFVEAEGRYLNTAGTGTLRIGFRRYDDKRTSLNYWDVVVQWDGTKTTTFTKKSGVYTVPSGTGYLQIWVTFTNNGETTNKAYIDNIRVHRMASGELIVDGAITAQKIAAGAITADKLNVTSLSAISANLGTVTAGNISGVTITGSEFIIDEQFALGNVQYHSTMTIDSLGFRLHTNSLTDALPDFDYTLDPAGGLTISFQHYSTGATISSFEVNQDGVTMTGDMIVNGGVGADSVTADVMTTDRINGLTYAHRIYFSPNGPYVDAYGGNARWKQSDGNYIFQGSTGDVRIYVGGTVKHTFYANGTKSGGSIEIDGINWGMSPIDSPRVMIADLITNVDISPFGTEVRLESRFAKTLERYSVFPSDPTVKIIKKEADRFIAVGSGTCDFYVIGVRVGRDDVYFENLSILEEKR
ncbi:hypothetical protein ETC03_15750 [Geobacillus sp. MMMUD3]|nr:hypothetical protein [Geobacillus sp. MMMUD3]